MPVSSEQFSSSLLQRRHISVSALRQMGLSLEETTYLAIGGGMGSFTWVDNLIIHGADPTQIVAVGLASKPYARFRRLCRSSQIFDCDRLRSDSGGTPDNIWGWPGYAVREIWHNLKDGHLLHAAWLAWQIFSEPLLCDPFTPQSGQVFASLDREARRIGWDKIWRFGRVRAIRKTDDGRYVVVYSHTSAIRRRPKLIVARYIHLAVGYPALRLLPDLQSYRHKTSDHNAFVSAYEPHDHIYQHLRQKGGGVLLRGRGITASRIIQRLYEERCHNPNITLLHLMRTPKPVGSHYKYARRSTKNHFDHQAYNFPKSCFGGDFRKIIEQSDDQQRAELINLWGGITTAKRRPWERIIKAGLNEGWYQIRFGQILRAEPCNDGLAVVIQGNSTHREVTQFQADFIIDATGLETTPDHNPLLKDLIQTYQVPKSCQGQIKVTNNFEIAHLQNGAGRVYASGITTLGGPFAPVDSFVGLQYAAQQSLESLMALGAPGVRQLGPIRSIIQWSRWAAGVKP